MKKILMTALIALAVSVTAFAQSKTYVIDLADTTNGGTVSIGKNPYGPNYQNTNPPTFNKYFSKDWPQPGDVIEVHYKFTSSADLEGLCFMIIDPTEAAKYWLPISDQQEVVENIKAGQTCEGVLVFKVTKKPIAGLSVQLMYDQKVNCKIKLEKTGVKTGRK